jgi:hypothetical protein
VTHLLATREVALVAVVLSLAGCGSSGKDGAGSKGSPSPSATGTSDPIVIKTREVIPNGTILAGSTVAGAAFCPGGTFADKHGTTGIGLVERTITCHDGTLLMGFDPLSPVGNTQTGPWRIVSGTGAYKGWTGTGSMTITYDPSDTDPHPTHGNATYTGTVTR